MTTKDKTTANINMGMKGVDVIKVSVRYMFDNSGKTEHNSLNGESNKGLSNEVARFLVSDENLIIKNQAIDVEIA